MWLATLQRGSTCLAVQIGLIDRQVLEDECPVGFRQLRRSRKCVASLQGSPSVRRFLDRSKKRDRGSDSCRSLA